MGSTTREGLWPLIGTFVSILVLQNGLTGMNIYFKSISESEFSPYVVKFTNKSNFDFIDTAGTCVQSATDGVSSGQQTFLAS